MCNLRDLFYEAEKHIYELMKKNGYSRFAQSDQYKDLLANAIIPAPKRKLVFLTLKYQFRTHLILIKLYLKKKQKLKFYFS